MDSRICQFCNKPYEPKYDCLRAKYCSDKCRLLAFQKRHEETQKNGLLNDSQPTKTCEICENVNDTVETLSLCQNCFDKFSILLMQNLALKLLLDKYIKGDSK